MAIAYFISDDYERRTGGFVYNEHLADWLERHGDLTRYTVPACFPQPSHDTCHAVAKILAGLDAQTVLVTDHIYGCMFADLLAARSFRLVLVFHHSLAEEHADGSRHRQIERRALDMADLIVATSAASAHYLQAHYDIDSSRIVVAPPGNEKTKLHDDRLRSEGPWRLLSVGAVIPRKRYEFALEAVAALPARNWVFDIVGNTARYPDYVEALLSQAERDGLSGQVRLAGELSPDRLEETWKTADIYLASSAYEGYGMSISEAMCHGLPVVSTASGAVAGWAGKGAIILPADEPKLMAEALQLLMSDPRHYAEARGAALALADHLPSWDDTIAQAGDTVLALVSSPA